jgi:HTH-type transcriptional regulator/antitoxin HigA
MEGLKYTVIKNKVQYRQYCRTLADLIANDPMREALGDEIDLLTLLIEKWDAENNNFANLDPIQLILSFMSDHKMKARDLVHLLNVSKGYVSDILNYKKGLSKEIIRDLATHFSVSQEAFNRPYKLKSKPKNTRRLITKKQAATAR